MADQIDMKNTLIKCVDVLIAEESRIDKINVERKWKEIIDPAEPWRAKREYAGYAEILIKFVPVDKKDSNSE